MNKIAVFFFALITGMITRTGVMTVEQLIWSAWNSASDSLLFSLAPDLHIYVLIAGIIVFAIVAYYTLEPFIHGLKHGSEGVIIAIIGFIVGWVSMGFLMNYYDAMIGLPT